MKPKEKAKELVDRFREYADYLIMSDDPESNSMYASLELETKNAKQCALICVDEIVKELRELHHKTPLFFWQEVKQELNNL